MIMKVLLRFAVPWKYQKLPPRILFFGKIAYGIIPAFVAE